MPLNATLPLINGTTTTNKISLQIDGNTLQTEDVTIEDEATGA